MLTYDVVCSLLSCKVFLMSFPGDSAVKNLPANVTDTSQIPGSRRSLGEGNGKPLLSCFRNSVNRGAWWAPQSMGSLKESIVTQQLNNNKIFLIESDHFSCIIYFLLLLLLLLSLQSCPTLCDPVDGSLPSSPVPGILQARTLEWVAIAFSIYIHIYAFVKYVSIFPLIEVECTPITPNFIPVFLPGESQGRGSLVGFHLWGRTESDTTEVTQQ